MQEGIAQITLEKTFTESTWITNMANSGYKYYSMDVVNSQCKLYNLDYTLWKTIPVSPPAGYTLYDMQYVSENLFSTDGLIGMACMFYKYDATGQYYTYEVRIVKENGTILLNIPGAAYMYVLNAGATGSKFVTYQYDYSTYPYFLGTNIYGLPGIFTGESSTTGAGTSHLKAFPNPASGSITIPITEQDNSSVMEMIIIDLNGKEILRDRLSDDASSHTLNISSFPAGTYLYLVIADGTVVNSDKFIVKR